METRDMRIMVNRVGGKYGKNNLTYRICIPVPWARALGITKEDAEVAMDFDGDNIVIHRKKQ